MLAPAQTMSAQRCIEPRLHSPVDQRARTADKERQSEENADSCIGAPRAATCTGQSVLSISVSV